MKRYSSLALDGVVINQVHGRERRLDPRGLHTLAGACMRWPMRQSPATQCKGLDVYDTSSSSHEGGGPA